MKSVIRNTMNFSDSTSDSDEFTLCNICDQPHDCYDDYGLPSHCTEIPYNFTPEITTKLSLRCIRILDIMRKRKYVYNVKCDLIKELNRAIADMEGKIQIIAAILNGKITFGSSARTPIQQITDMGYRNSPIFITDITPGKITSLTEAIEIHKKDIGLLEQLQSKPRE